MVNLLKRNDDYMDFIRDIKNRVQSAQIKAAVSVNLELMRQWYLFWADGEAIMHASLAQNAIMQPSVAQIKKSQQSVDQVLIAKQLVSQIPWGHNLLVVSKSKNLEEALFYVRKTIENNWSRAVLTHQIEGCLFGREGKALTNFSSSLPAPQSDLARQTLKDPYIFDFLAIRDKHDERELEDALVGQVTKFLLELGAGFSFIGRCFSQGTRRARRRGKRWGRKWNRKVSD